MAKQSGLGDNFYIAGYDVSGDVNAIGRIATPRGVLEATGINKSAFERIVGIRDGGMEFTSLFNDADDQEHEALASLSTADRMLTYCRGTTLGNPGAAMIGKQLNYDAARGTDGSLLFSVNAEANAYGLDWGRQLTAGKRTDTTATNGTGVDHTAVSTAFGWTAYLQVFSFTGTSVTITIQDSADNAAWANLSGGAFAVVSGRTTERLASSSPTATVRRYLRAITAGTFSNVVFNVVFVRNEAAVSV